MMASKLKDMVDIIVDYSNLEFIYSPYLTLMKVVNMMVFVIELIIMPNV